MEQLPNNTYCLGVGCMDKCNTCQHLKNWNTLNNELLEQRETIQKSMQRINESYCQITHGSLFTEK